MAQRYFYQPDLMMFQPLNKDTVFKVRCFPIIHLKAVFRQKLSTFLYFQISGNRERLEAGKNK